MLGPMLGDDLIEMIQDALQAQRQLVIRRPDATAANVCQFAASFIDDPKACNAQARIYAKDTYFFTY